MAQTKRATAQERMQCAHELMLGLPWNISVEGARKVEQLVEYLYEFRVATLEQLARCLPGDTEKRIGYWLDRYPYINKQMVSMDRYDVNRGRWVTSKNIGVYTLTSEAVMAYELAKQYDNAYGSKGTRTKHKPRNLESMVQAIDLFTRVVEVNRGQKVEWMNNQFVSSELRKMKLLGMQDSLSTIGFVDTQDGVYWGVGLYLKTINGIISHTQKAFPADYKDSMNAVMLVRGEHLGRAHELAYIRDRSKWVANGYYRFIPYEFSLEHPNWFLALLRGNRWAVLEPLFESIRQRGGGVEQVRSVDKVTAYESFRFRITHPPDEFGHRTVEYVDTTYGAQFTETVDLITRKSNVEAAARTLYVMDPSEIEVFQKINAKEQTAGIVYRCIDWPGGK